MNLEQLLAYARTPLPGPPMFTAEQLAQLKASALSAGQGLAGLLPYVPEGALPQMPEWMRRHIEERGLAPYQEDGPGRARRIVQP